MQFFYLDRTKAIAPSTTGRVIEGVVFSDGTVAFIWVSGDITSGGTHDTVEEFKAIRCFKSELTATEFCPIEDTDEEGHFSGIEKLELKDPITKKPRWEGFMATNHRVVLKELRDQGAIIFLSGLPRYALEQFWEAHLE